MSRSSIVVFVAVVALVMIVGQAEATTISGSLETCPINYDPIEDAPIRIYINQTFVGIRYIDSFGEFSADVTFWGLTYGDVITVSLGPAEFPYTAGMCPTQHSRTFVGLSIVFPAIKFECGSGKAPPCPQM